MTLESVSTAHLRQVLAEVDDAAATERLMAALTYKEIDEVTQEDAAELYGYSAGWASKWFNRLERLADEPFEEVVYDEPRPGRPAELTEQEHEQFVESLHEQPEEVGIDAPACGLFHWLAGFSATSSMWSSLSVMSGDCCPRPGCPGRQPGRSTTRPTNEHKTLGRKGSKKAR